MGRERRLHRYRFLPSHWAAPVAACILVTSFTMGAPAQETASTSTSTIEVSVLPVGGALTITSTADSVSPASPDIVAVPLGMAMPVPTDLPVTVSATMHIPDGQVADMPTDIPSTFITVNDDRGTGRGWKVILDADSAGQGWNPMLEVNDPATITRLVPAPELGPTPYDAVSVGDMVSDLSDPMTVLHADEGQGSGMFVQTLAIDWPLPGDGPGLVSIQLPSGP
jgi:hypothetical protein